MNNNNQLLKTDFSTIRLDKNIAASIDMIWLDELGLSQEDKSLIKSIVYYICVERQTNLFGYGSIDPAHFAQVMNYPEGYLRKPHADPLQTRYLSDQEKQARKVIEQKNPENKIMDSLLENALHILHTQAMQLKVGAQEVVFEDDGATSKYIALSNSYIFLTELDVITIKKKGKPKIMFRYKVAPKFTTNLSLYFLRFSLDAFICLRRSGNDDMYLHLKELKEIFLMKKKNGQDYERGQNFNFLCNKAQISFFTKEGKEKDNREVKRGLNDILELINLKTDLKFLVVWVKKYPKSKWKYEPEFYFTEVETFDKRSFRQQVNESKEKIEEKGVIFKENLLHELLDTYRNHNNVSGITEGLEQLFYLWVISNRNTNEKGLAFQNAQYKTFGALPKDIDEIKKEWLSSLESLRELGEVTKTWEMYAEKKHSQREKLKGILAQQNPKPYTAV
ncbi:MAG: hypothetical protein LBV47_01195 [Bacteroidales bacterium]|jgi:hypothetical protein|nr:hypothetical protein [Bacteroidales bacterium]